MRYILTPTPGRWPTALKWVRLSMKADMLPKNLISAPIGEKYPIAEGTICPLLQCTVSYGAHWVDAYAATQCLLWEFSIDFRTNPNGFNNPDGYDGSQIYDMTIKGYPAESVYNQILAKIREHDSIPSFAGKTSSSAPVHKMTWNSSTNRCEYKVPTSQVSSYKFTTLPTGVHVTTSGSDTIFYTTAKVDANSGVVTMKKDLPAPSQNILVFRKSGGQTCITGTAEDPVAGYFKLESELAGNLSIIKTSQHNGGSVSGFTFEVRNSSRAGRLFPP